MIRGQRKPAILLDALVLAAAVAAFVLGSWVNVHSGGMTLSRIATTSMKVHVDFQTFWLSAEAVWGGGDIYHTGATLPNLNPPFWTLVFSPLGLLEPLDAYRIFVLLTLLLFVCYTAWTAHELRLGGGWASFAAGALFLSSPLLATLALGQIYAVVTLALVASWVADRRGRRVLSGVALGLAVAVKPSLAPALLWYVMRGRWVSFGSAVAAGALATLGAALALGPWSTMEWLRVAFGNSVDPYWDNASLPGTAARLFTRNPYSRALAEAPVMIYVAYAVAILLLLYTCYRVWRDSETGLWAMVAASLLLSPISWNNYLMLLAPGILVLLARRRYAPALLLLALQYIPPEWPLLWAGKGTVAAALAMGLYLYSLLIHWAAFTFSPRAAVEKGA
ncbi:MAG: DUF2029 domain-containing protein [Rubrobacteraceae bacterium]|nr:DUF2029 domain-containing protein [Rubrobacteraceae bacterium]MCL6439289.1 DUF2029 domain-containing protein [Rubrobacteraceae bacterium]